MDHGIRLHLWSCSELNLCIFNDNFQLCSFNNDLKLSLTEISCSLFLGHTTMFHLSMLCSMMIDFKLVIVVPINNFSNFNPCSCKLFFFFPFFAAKEETDGCICFWGGWNWWSSDTPHSGGPEIPVYDVIRGFFSGLTDVIC